MMKTKTAYAYLNDRPIITGLFTVLLTVIIGMSIAFVTGLTTPAQVLAQVLPPCCAIPAPTPPPPPPVPTPPAPIVPSAVLPPCCALPEPTPPAPAPAPALVPTPAPTVPVSIVTPDPVIPPPPAPVVIPPAPVVPITPSEPTTPIIPTTPPAPVTPPVIPPVVPPATPPTGGGAGGTPTGGDGGGGGGAGGTPNVTLAMLPHLGPQPLAYLYLSQIPYTGLDLGPIGTPLYWVALIGLALALTYFMLFVAVPFTKRHAHDFGARVSALLNTPKLAPAIIALPVSTPMPHIVVEAVNDDASLAPNGYSSYDGFKSFARNGALSIEDIVKGLSQQKQVAAAAPIVPVASFKPAYEHVEAIVAEAAKNVEPITPAADPANVPADVRGFASALVEGDRTAVFAGLRQYVRGGGAPEHLVSSVVCLLDDTYRARIDGSNCDATIARLTARLDTPKLEKLIASLATAIDSSYTDSVTGAKLALTRALSVLGAFD